MDQWISMSAWLQCWQEMCRPSCFKAFLSNSTLQWVPWRGCSSTIQPCVPLHPLPPAAWESLSTVLSKAGLLPYMSHKVLGCLRLGGILHALSRLYGYQGIYSISSWCQLGWHGRANVLMAWVLFLNWLLSTSYPLEVFSCGWPPNLTVIPLVGSLSWCPLHSSNTAWCHPCIGGG